MPARKSSPSASNGATPARLAAASQRSGSSAAHASACGPPPDQPSVDEAVEPELVEDRGDVGRRVGHAAPLVAGRARVSGPRVGDELPAALVDRVGQQRELVGRVRRADWNTSTRPSGAPWRMTSSPSTDAQWSLRYRPSGSRSVATKIIPIPVATAVLRLVDVTADPDHEPEPHEDDERQRVGVEHSNTPSEMA